LTRAYGGAAEKYSESATGATDRLNVAVENLEESLGKGLLPVIADVAHAFAGAAGAAERFNDWLGRFGADKSGLKYLKDLGSAADRLLGGKTFDPRKLSPGMAALALAPGGPLARNVPAGAFNRPGVFGAPGAPGQFRFGGAFVPTAQQRHQWFGALIGRRL